MKRVILGLICLVSLVFAETPNELFKRVFVNTKNIYKLDLEKGKCTKLSPKRKKEIIYSWALMERAGLPLLVHLADLQEYSEGNGRYVFFAGLAGFSAYMMNNLDWCNTIFRKNNIKAFNNMLQQRWGYDKKIYYYDEYMKK